MPALVPLGGVGRTILRGALSLTLTSFAAIGFGIAYTVGCYLLHPADGPIYSGWIAWVLLFSGFAGPFLRHLEVVKDTFSSGFESHYSSVTVAIFGDRY
jgi:hypothetical protein